MSLDLSALYLSCHKDLTSYLSNLLHCQDTAEDIAHEAFIALGKVTQQSKVVHPRGFLFRTAGNLAVDYLRHNQVINRHVDKDFAWREEPQQASPEQEVAYEERLALLKQTIAELPPRTRDVFILHKLHDYSYREIAAMLNITESGVEKHISKGLKYCRIQLGHYFQSSEVKDWGN
jgi:RNA polymerase sigma factor (sigma-70 family)